MNIPITHEQARRLARRALRLSPYDSVRVIFLGGARAADPPRLAGEAGHYMTIMGIPIRYPSAYGKVGWSSLVRHASTHRIEVGTRWSGFGGPVMP